MKIDCISDLHGFYPELEGGDLLIIAGDLTASDTLEQHSDVLNWIHKQDYRKKILIGGNHDNFLQKNSNFYSKTHMDYLCDSGTEFESLKIWGSPWTHWFKGVNPHCKAFMISERSLPEKWVMIPLDTDILVTHSPPWDILDEVDAYPDLGNKNCGCYHLRKKVEEIKPKIHVFGHIHEGYGKMLLKHIGPNTICVNASHVNEAYEPVNKPISIIL